MDASVGKSRKSGITNSRESVFYDLAEFAPPNDPFDNSNPTTPRIGTNLLGSAAGAPNPQDLQIAMEKITQARRVTRPRPRHSIGLSQDVIVLNNPDSAFMNPGFGLSSFRATP
jgi:hypothetical protein